MTWRGRRFRFRGSNLATAGFGVVGDNVDNVEFALWCFSAFTLFRELPKHNAYTGETFPFFEPREQRVCHSVLGIINIIEPKTGQLIGHAARSHHLSSRRRLGTSTVMFSVRTLFDLASRYVKPFQQIPHALAAPQTPTFTSYVCWLARRWRHTLVASTSPNLAAQRRRGRWTSERTFEGHIQESTCFPHSLTLAPVTGDRIEGLADLAPAVFREDPPTAPTSTDTRQVTLAHPGREFSLPPLRRGKNMKVLSLCCSLLYPLESPCHHVTANLLRTP